VRVLSATFLKSGVGEETWPNEPVPEICFAGRSNVGKSSMLNKLAGRNGIARVSNTPGRTRTLNFYEIKIEREATQQRIWLCDLPGYGFAKAGKVDRAAWGEMIRAYLQRRDTLTAVVQIIDSYVGPTKDDEASIEYLVDAKRPLLVVATKLDKLPKAKRTPRRKEIARMLGLPERGVIGFSATDGFGRDEVWGAILEAIHGDDDAPADGAPLGDAG
jgi:GTP-binding protein